MIVLDTNVLSEAVRPQPDEAVVRWLRFAPRDELFTTAIAEAEMRYGAARLPAGRNRKEREMQIDRIFTVRFAGCILPFDSRSAQVFPNVILSMQKQGRSYSFPDAQIAAIALAHGAAVATRNVTHFEHSGVQIINPWTASP
ncbi:MAG TPA: type II toxin-antitoxin system VapC family toxin [Rhizomicrobium sp.]|nr:type II toxin-antitoxin system VapC family toxin [Rhizomicrobium sp.]